MVRGVNVSPNAVKATLGEGHNVVLEELRRPDVTKDGVSVAKEIELSASSRTWARRWSGSRFKTSDNAGDGTTTATVLAQALIAGSRRSPP